MTAINFVFFHNSFTFIILTFDWIGFQHTTVDEQYYLDPMLILKVVLNNDNDMVPKLLTVHTDCYMVILNRRKNWNTGKTGHK